MTDIPRIVTTEIGDFTVHLIEDGHLKAPTSYLFPNSDQSVWTPDLPGIDDESKLRVTFGCFLIIGKDSISVVDTGHGKTDEQEVGGLQLGLNHLGIANADVHNVVHTHLHPDHVNGDSDGEVVTFPNATHFVHEREFAYWFDEAHEDRERGRERFRPVVKAGLHKTITEESEIAGHLRVFETFGHSPGHVSVVLRGGGGERLFITGDIAHHPMQGIHPDWNVAFDMEPDQAAATRARVMKYLAKEDVTIAAGHFPAPNFATASPHEDGGALITLLDM